MGNLGKVNATDSEVSVPHMAGEALCQSDVCFLLR